MHVACMPPSASSPSLCRGTRSTHSLAAKGIDGLDLSRHVVRHWLEVLEDLLGLGDDFVVLEHRAVVLEVHVCLLLLEHSQGSASILGPLAEGLQGSRGVLAQVQSVQAGRKG